MWELQVGLGWVWSGACPGLMEWGRAGTWGWSEVTAQGLGVEWDETWACKWVQVSGA